MRQVHLPLSSLVPSRRNPRKVKPDREAHRQLVASIRANGLLHPLTVRPCPEQADHYLVIAGHRRLAALRAIHRGNGTGVKVFCQVRDVDEATADALSLSENFSRAGMHPLDEAEAFARLVAHEGRSVEAVAAEFGVSEHYVRQRMKLASLSSPVKTAYRHGQIDTGTAEAFAAVPEDRQKEVWTEVGGTPRNADQVRNIIAHAWIDATLARFDLTILPEDAVSRDLFSERVLVERTAFLEAQTQAMEQQRQALLEDGWSAVVTGQREELFSQMYAMMTPAPEYDEKTRLKLAKLSERQTALEAALEQGDENDTIAQEKFQRKLATLEEVRERVLHQAPEFNSEATKAIGTVFLMLDPDGALRQEVRIPHPRGGASSTCSTNSEEGASPLPQPPTCEKLNDRQLATTFTHQTLAVREAVFGNPLACKRLLVLMLHEKVLSDALALRHISNEVTSHATQTEGFTSPALDRLTQRRTKLDPFSESAIVDDCEGYEKLAKLSTVKLDALIDLLIVEHLTTLGHHRTTLVDHLYRELRVDVRKTWCPDAIWLANYQKCQLAGLLSELLGPTYDPSRETRKKTELVEALAKLFADAAAGKLEDKELSNRINQWLPANLRKLTEETNH